MNIKRFIRHLCMPHWRVRRDFPPVVLAAIELAVHESESRHSGQIRFAVEGALGAEALWRGQSPRERALEVFAQLHVWDTEHNNGLLIYVLLADRAVEIVADRGIHAKVGAPGWREVCQTIEQAFTQQQFQTGAVEGIRAASRCLEAHFPGGEQDPNELPDAPVML